MCRKYFKEIKIYKKNILLLFNDPDLVNLGIKGKLTMPLIERKKIKPPQVILN